MYKNGQIYVDMNCQQICKISRKKTYRSENITKVMGGYFFETPCIFAKTNVQQ